MAKTPDDTGETPDQSDELCKCVEIRRKRREDWERVGERSIGQNIAMIGMIGWLVVTPMLAGIFVGRWMDEMFGSGIFWTGALLMVGTVIGGALAWKRLRREQSE